MEKKYNTIILETSGQIGAVAIACGDEILAQKRFSGIMKHSSELLPAISELVRQAGWASRDIEHIYVSAGPGSFTGLRLAVTTAKALAYALNCRIVPVPSIEAQVLNAQQAIADGVVGIENVAVVLHAGRDMVFGGIYCRDIGCDGNIPNFMPVFEPTMVSVEDLLSQVDGPLFVLGLGINYHRDKFIGDNIILLDEKYWQPQVGFVQSCGYRRAMRGCFVGVDAYDDAVKFEPIYMRKPEAELKWQELGRA